MRHSPAPQGIITFLFVLCAVNAQAQWTQTSNGFNGAQVSALTNINETIFAGTLGGVFRSTDNANTWTSVNSGLAGNNVNSLIAAGSTLYVALNGGGTYRSSDSGASWQLITVPSTLVRLAAVGNTVYGLTNNGAFYSIASDSNTATLINTGLAGMISFTVSGTTLFLGTNATGLYTSTNAGATWTPVSFTPAATSVWSLDARGTTIIAWINSNIMISTNGGTSWSNTGLPQGYSYLGLLGSKIIAGGQFNAHVSNDSGINWSEVTSLPAIVGFASNTAGHYAGTINGVYRSVDSGVTWADASAGMTGGNVRSIAALNNKLFAAHNNVLYSSADWSATWQPLSAGIPYGHPVMALAVTGSNVVAGTYGNGIYVSSNGGTSWVWNNSLVGATCFVQLGNDLYAGNYQGVYVSKDNGSTWAPFSAKTFVNALGVRGNDLYVGAIKLTRFTNAGLANQSERELSFANPVSAFTLVGDQLFCGTTNSGVFTTTDNGETWTAVNTGLTSSFIVTALTSFENYLYVSRMGEGVYYSANKGASWTSYNTGIPAFVTNNLNSLSALRVVAGKLFAGASSAAVWSICPFLTVPVITAKDLNTPSPMLTSSEAADNQWFFNGVPIASATGPSITATQSGAYYVEVPTASGCKRKSADIAIVITGVASFEESHRLEVFPNPASGVVNIDLKNVPLHQHVVLDVFDATGKSQTVINGYGGQQIQLDVNGYSAGLYIIRSRQANTRQVARFMKQ